MSTDPADLEFTADEMRRMGHATVERLVDHVLSLETQPARGDVAAADLCRRLREPAPERGVAYEPLLDRLLTEWVPRSFTTSGPGYLAYIPGGGLYPAGLADLIAGVVNRYTGVRLAAPALVQLEANALDWLREWMAFPAGTRGLFTTGGSMAHFNAVLCARERHLGPDIRAGVLYGSTQMHHSMTKSARLAGIMPDRVRAVPVDERFRMDVGALADMIAADRRAGLRPFCVASAAGTTNTGAVDPLNAVTDLCAREGLWHHVDGAYGAFFHLCPELRDLMPGLSRADSLTLDPHKGLFLPYGTGALLVRDGAALRHTHEATAGYMPGRTDDEEYDPHLYGPELSRGFPGLRVWLCVKLYGAGRLRAALAEKRALALEAAAHVAAVPGIVMAAPPQVSLFAFHLRWPGSSLAEENQATEFLVERVNLRNRVMLSGAVVDERFLARVCVLSFRTRARHVDACVTDLTEEAASVLAEIERERQRR